jgi:hypothetical protein
MSTLRALASVLLALALLAGAAAQGARAAGMAMPMALGWSVDSAEPCGLCDGRDAAQMAAHCALTCAGAIAMVSDLAALDEPASEQTAAGAPVPIAGRFAVPEPDPPR